MLGLWVAFPGRQEPGVVETGVRVSLAASCGLFLAAAVLRLSAWRFVRTTQTLLVAIGVAVLGAFVMPASVVWTSIGSSAEIGVALRGLGLVVCIACLVRALAADGGLDSARPTAAGGGFETSPSGSPQPPRSRLALAICVPLVAVGVAGAIVPGPDAERWLIGGFVALAWLATGWGAATRWSASTTGARLLPLTVAMAIAELLWAAAQGHNDGWALASALLYVFVATSAMCFAFRDLDAVVRRDHDEIAEALADAQSVAAAEQSWRAEVAHDARNGCAGLRAALLTIDQFGGQLDEELLQDLRRAALEEVTHLEHLLARAKPQPAETFDVSALVHSVVAARRASGSHITVLSSKVQAQGRSQDVATALQNILVNAERYAPGSPVVVNVGADAEQVVIAVADSGPGVPTQRRDLIFERGAHAEGEGTGLGLYRARSLMRAQGGDAVLRDQAVGACFVLTLPAAPTPVVPVIPRQRVAPAELTAAE